MKFQLAISQAFLRTIKMFGALKSEFDLGISRLVYEIFKCSLKYQLLFVSEHATVVLAFGRDL